MPSAEFEAAALKVKTLTKSPDNTELLQVYALFKQASVGDLDPVKNPRPGVFDIKGKAKWDEWQKLLGTSKEDAEKQYIALVDSLMTKYQ